MIRNYFGNHQVNYLSNRKELTTGKQRFLVISDDEIKDKPETIEYEVTGLSNDKIYYLLLLNGYLDVDAISFYDFKIVDQMNEDDFLVYINQNVIVDVMSIKFEVR